MLTIEESATISQQEQASDRIYAVRAREVAVEIDVALEIFDRGDLMLDDFFAEEENEQRWGN